MNYLHQHIKHLSIRISPSNFCSYTQILFLLREISVIVHYGIIINFTTIYGQLYFSIKITIMHSVKRCIYFMAFIIRRNHLRALSNLTILSLNYHNFYTLKQTNRKITKFYSISTLNFHKHLSSDTECSKLVENLTYRYITLIYKSSKTTKVCENFTVFQTTMKTNTDFGHNVPQIK